MSVLYKIGNDCSLLEVTEKENGLQVILGVRTIVWSYFVSESTLDQVLQKERQQIYSTLINLDKANQLSKSGLKYLLNELNNKYQLTLNL